MARALQMSLAMTRPHRSTRGFTLVELMVVVVIVAILAVLAVVGYRALVTSAHTSEATGMVGSIRTAQEAYHAETQTYVSTTTGGLAGSPPTGLYPTQNSPPGQWKTGWGGGLGGACPALPGASINCWGALPIHVDSAVMFGYATVGGTAGTATYPSLPTINGASITTPTGVPPMDWYFIGAYGDVNGNGVVSSVIAQSFTNDIFIDKEGE
jgi:type IV pilus assembly protein PilA